MDIRSFFAKKSSSDGASAKATVNTSTPSRSLMTNQGAVIEKQQRTGTSKKRTPEVLKEADATVGMTGFETSDDNNDNNEILLPPSPTKKLKPSPVSSAKSPPTPTTTVTSRISPRSSITTRVDHENPLKLPPTPSAATSATKTPPLKHSPRKAKASPTPDKMALLESIEDRESYDLKTDNIVPECLQGLTFCLTGVMEELNRIDTTELLKSLGAKVTTAISGRTSFLVVGPLLEDGRPSETSLKYREAVDKGTRMITSIQQLYGLCHQYQERAMKLAGVTKEGLATKKGPPAVEPPSTAVQAKTNPYAKKPVINPYATKASAGGTAATAHPPTATTSASNSYTKKSNPYQKERSASSSAVTLSSSVPSSSPPSSNKPGELWVDRHAPKSTRDILGNTDNVGKLRIWLNNWERTFNKPEAYGKSFSALKGPWKAALLSGPPGIGKTTTATLVAKEAGRDLREFNASDARSKKALQQQLGDLTGSQSLGFSVEGSQTMNKKQLRCVIMDEVDGMGAGDRGGTQELIQMIKKSKVPIICICNDRQAQSIKSLVPYCMDLRFRRPTKSVMANRAIRVAELEGMYVERNAAEAIAESCGNDVRQILNVMQMWAQKKGSKEEGLSYQTLKERETSINKDEILRVGLFDAAKSIMEGRRGLSGTDNKTQVDSLFKRSDAFFVDYSFTGLLVQQNYTKVMDGPWGIVKKADNNAAEFRFLDRVHDAALSMSDYAMFDHGIRGNGDLNWSLLPASGMMVVKTGYHAGGKAGGFLNGYPEFTAWLGKNSSRSKKQRLLSELHHHMNYKISADSQQLRESYLPVFRERFLEYFRGADRSDEANDAAIALMDDYGLSREDVMEKLDEFKLCKDKAFADLDSKQKAAFTRRWNQGSHRSQALVAEELGLNKQKKNKATRTKGPADLDAIDEDGDESESEDEDEEAELKKLAEKLGKTRGKSAKASHSTKNRKKSK